MAYDAGRNRVVMFGGWDLPGNTLNDTWEWVGNNWVQRTPANAPSPRTDTCLVYDSARNVCVLFGGFEPNLAVSYNDTWEYDGTNWTQIAGLTPPSTRDGFAFAFDSARSRLVIFGGWDANNAPFNDTWEYDGNAWTQVNTANAPSPRYYASMAYDPARGRCVMYGGENNGQISGETWEYDGGNWTLATAASAPGPREAMTMVHEPAAGRTILFGGADSGFNALGDTWAYGGAATASYSTFGVGCPGSNGTPTLNPLGVPALGQPFSVNVTNLPAGGGVAYMVLGFSNTGWNGQPLPLNLAAFGLSPACSGLVSVDDGNLLLHPSGTATWSIPIPNNPALAGFGFYNQAASFDPGAPGGLAFSDGGSGRIN